MIIILKSIENDFTAGMNPERLTKEINDSAISQPLVAINAAGDDCKICFDDTLTAGEESELETIITNHSGQSLYIPQPDQIQFYVDALKTRLDSAGYTGQPDDLQAIAVWMMSQIDSTTNLAQIQAILKDFTVITFSMVGALAHGYQTRKEL